jgi:hypothetical protein
MPYLTKEELHVSDDEEAFYFFIPLVLKGEALRQIRLAAEELDAGKFAEYITGIVPRLKFSAGIKMYHELRERELQDEELVEV